VSLTLPGRLNESTACACAREYVSVCGFVCMCKSRMG
jgi:hypothetical protein